MQIELIADADRAEFLLKYLDLPVQISRYNSNHFIVLVSSDVDTESSLALKVFHAGIAFGMQEARKSFDAIYRPNRFKDDIMYLEHD